MKEDVELFEQARRRVQNKRRCVTNKDVIVYQEKEIEYYRDKIQKLEGVIHNKRTFERKFEITLNDEEYLIEYNDDADIVMLNTCIVKLVNEKDKHRIAKDNEFNIINKTRFDNSKYKWEQKELRYTTFDEC